MHRTLLQSERGEVTLLNCESRNGRVLVGLACFDASLPALINLFDDKQKQIGVLTVPGEVRRSHTATLMCSPNDNLEFEFTEY